MTSPPPPADDLRAAVLAAVADAPPLTPAQVDTLRALLRPAPDAGATSSRS